MAGTGWSLVEAGRRWNVNPALIAAIAGTESSFGAAACGTNFWGWNSCNGHPWTTLTDGIQYVARALREHYLDQGRTSLYSLGYRYCGAPTICNLDRWVAHTGWYMRKLGSDGRLTWR